MHNGDEQQAHHVYQEVTLPAFDLLARIIASFSALFGHLDALTVKQARTRPDDQWRCAVARASDHASLAKSHRAATFDSSEKLSCMGADREVNHATYTHCDSSRRWH